MRKFLLLFCLTIFVSLNSWGQNAIVGSGFSSGWGGSCPSTGNSDFTFFTDSGINGTYISPTLNANGTGNQFWRFGVDWNEGMTTTTKQLTNTIGSDDDVTPGTMYTLNAACTTSGALRYNVTSTAYNYIFKTRNAGTNPTGDWTFFEIQGDVRSVSSVSQDLVTVYPGQDVTVTANLDGALSTGQGVYLRYTDASGNFASSTVVEMTGSGTTYTASIPSATNSASGNISYYVFTSGSGLTISSGNADLYSINLNNNGGSNYSYTTQASWTTANDGNWTTASTWDAGVVPVAGQPVTIENNVNLTTSLSLITAPNTITINSGSQLTISSSPNTITTTNIVNAGSLTFDASSTASLGTITNTNSITINGNVNTLGLTNSGTFNANGNVGVVTVTNNILTTGGTINVGSSAYLGFSSAFNNSLGTVNVSGTLGLIYVTSLGTTPSFSGTSPVYTATSTLGYAIQTGNTLTVGDEWKGSSTSVGSGVPQNVDIGTVVTDGSPGLNLPNHNVYLAGNLTIGASVSVPSNPSITTASTNTPVLTQSTSPTTDLYLGGNFTNNGTLNGNDKAVFFNGTGEQTIGGSAITTFDYLVVEKSMGEVKLTNEINIDNQVDLDNAGNMADINLNENNMNLTGASSFITEDITNENLIYDSQATTEDNKGGAIIVTGRSAGEDLGDSRGIGGMGITIADAGTGGSISTLDITRYHFKAAAGGAGPRVYQVTGTITSPATANLSILTYGSDTPSSSALWKWDSTNGWQLNNGMGITSFSHWTLADGTVSLPVELLSFAGSQINERQAKLTWQTATEKNNLGFEIQASPNAQDFKTLAFVEGAGNSSRIQNYEVLLNNTSSNYFRLKQIDENGDFSFSDIIFIEAETPKEEVVIYPNPTAGEVHIKGIDTEEVITVYLYNTLGKRVFEVEDSLEQAESALQSSFEYLNTGTYILQIVREHSTSQHRVFKTR